MDVSKNTIVPTKIPAIKIKKAPIGETTDEIFRYKRSPIVPDLKRAESEIKKIETKICQKCNETNSILTQLCVKCGNPFNINILKEDEHRNEFDKFLKDFLVELAKKDSTVKKVFRQMVKERKLEYLFQN